MALIRKVKRILTEAFPPPAKLDLRDEDGIIGVITSTRFRNKDMMDRQTLLHKVLEAHGLTPDERRRIVLLVAVTPEEAAALSATD